MRVCMEGCAVSHDACMRRMLAYEINECLCSGVMFDRYCGATGMCRCDLIADVRPLCGASTVVVCARVCMCECGVCVCPFAKEEHSATPRGVNVYAHTPVCVCMRACVRACMHAYVCMFP